ncbi:MULTISPECIES: lipopolysaccharide biosynthesis protein [Synergistaceae]|uniref:lipopolysaccharide biosynthesis protein n=1 Tax=Synergistaceae TaxID=649777 RepID=UPI003AE9E183|nr:polysaccharide biosynthesis C-terminal domain-containing protein [Synergistaceae bacterium DZ-S4]
MQIVKTFRTISKTDLLRSAGTYGIFSLINSAIPFFLLPVLTRYLSPEDYGYVSVFNIMLSIAVALGGCNFAGAYSRAYFAEDRFQAPVYFGTVVMATMYIGAIFTLLVLVTKSAISNLFSFPASWLWLVPVSATALSINNIILAHWQVRNKPRHYGLFINTRTIFRAIMSIIFVVMINLNWRGQVFAIVSAPFIFAPIGLMIMKNSASIYFSIDKIYLKHALNFGIPLIPHALAGILNSSINRIFISKMIGLAETGLFTVGFQLGSLILLFVTAFNHAYSPWLFKKLNQKSYVTNIKIVKLTYLYFIIILLGTLIYGMSAPSIIQIFVGKEFQGSYVYVLWISLGFAFTGMYYMVVNYIFYAEKTKYLALATITTSLLNIGLNYIFIKRNGPIGAAQATTITSFCTFLLVWYLSSKVYKMPWNIFKLLK